jgi:outer membrane protein
METFNFFEGGKVMKKRYLLISMVIVALSFLSYGSLAMASEKTGFVDIREVMLKSIEGKKAAEEFRKVYEKDKNQIQAKETELKKLKEDIEKQRTVLTETAMKEKEAAYQKKFRDYQLQVKDANEELQARDQELSKKMLPEILKVVHNIGDKEKYTVIIDIGTVPLAYFAKENDLTKRVIEEFNKTYKPKN